MQGARDDEAKPVDQDLVRMCMAHGVQLMTCTGRPSRRRSSSTPVSSRGLPTPRPGTCSYPSATTTRREARHIMAIHHNTVQVRETFDQYFKVSGYEVVRTLAEEFKGTLLLAYNVILQAGNRPATFFARSLAKVHACCGVDMCVVMGVHRRCRTGTATPCHASSSGAPRSGCWCCDGAVM